MRFKHLIFTVSTLVFVALAGAQVSANSPRITSPVVETQLTTLHGNVSARAHAEFDQGAASPSTPMTHMRLVLSRTAAQEAALNLYMKQQLDPSSPNYHKWLTPAQYGQLYGANIDDVHAITAWLQSHGFAVERIDSGRTSIAFSGTVDQVENAFHTRIHQFNANGESFISNITDPQIPAALGSVVIGVARLNTIKPRAMHEPGQPGIFDKNTHKFVPISSVDGARPELTTASPNSFYLTPQDAAIIYNSPINSGFPGTSANNGAGITIGIGGDAVINPATVWSYRNRFLGQAIPSFSTTTEPCGPSESDCTGTIAVTTQGQLTIFNLENQSVCLDTAKNCDVDEAYIDTELAGGIAPGANIYFYTSPDLNSAIEQMINDNKVNIFSLSFGECEKENTASGNLQVYNWWKQASAQGISVFVSTGDNGSAGCDDDNTEKVSTQGLQINGLASTPYNVAVGGTDFYPLLTSFSTYVGSTNGTYYGSALSFIPESTWNDSTSVNTTIADNEVQTGTASKGVEANIVGGSGGVSSCATGAGTTCAGYPKPSWQSAPGVPADGLRDIPDVSLFASNGNDSAAWLVCVDGTFTDSGVTYNANCETFTSGPLNGEFSWAGFGGTSTSAPATAGIFALLAQAQGGSIGLPNPTLYTLASGSNASKVFYDTVVGNNSVPCSTSPVAGQCTAAASGDYLTGYNTATGYDLATGLGSLNITNLINDWSTAIALPTATVTIGTLPATLYQSSSLPVTVTVTGVGTPSGTVTFSSGSYSSAAQPLVGGSLTFTIPAWSLAAGSDTITASYSGDSDNGTANGTGSITVTASTFTFSASAVTLAPGAATGNTSTITITPSGQYAGNVTFTASVTASPAGAVSPPTFAYSSALTFTAGSSTAQTGTITINTTAASSSAIKAPGAASAGTKNSSGWLKAAGGTILASFLLLLVPGARKWRRVMMGLLFIIAASFSVMGCGGGGGSGGGGGGSTGTTAGTYTITVTATGTETGGSGTVTPATQTFTLTVN